MQLFELPLRIVMMANLPDSEYFIWKRDLHIFVAAVIASSVGVWLGDKVAHRVSQALFEYFLISLLTLTALAILGIFSLEKRALFVAWSLAVALVARCVLNRG